MSADYEELRERLADLCHQQWAGWMSYLFEKAKQNDDGTFTIPAHLVGRWHRQMHASYKDLPENEAESDRKEADRFVQLVAPDLSAAQTALAEAEAVRVKVERLAEFYAKNAKTLRSSITSEEYSVQMGAANAYRHCAQLLAAAGGGGQGKEEGEE